MMAKIISTLLGVVRKSVGNINFYRVKGVQIARAKRSPRPNNGTTPLQNDWSYKWGFAQYVLNKADWKSFAWLFDIGAKYKNPKTEMFSHMLKGLRQMDVATDTSYYEQLIKSGDTLIKYVAPEGFNIDFRQVWLDKNVSTDLGHNVIFIDDDSHEMENFLHRPDDPQEYTYENLVMFGYASLTFPPSPYPLPFDGIVPLTVYPTKCAIYRNDTYGNFYYFPINAGLMGATGIYGKADFEICYMNSLMIYLAIVAEPEGFNIIQSGKVIRYTQIIKGS